MGTQKLTALIVGSAEGPGLRCLQRYLTGEELVICADGGVKTAEKMGLKPNWYVGDSDSGGSPIEGAARWLLPSEKDLTDLEMGVEVALEQGVTRLILCGCTGGRGDHHLINLLLLEQIARRGAEGMILDAQNEIRFLAPGTYVLENRPRYHYFSLISLDARLQGLHLEHCKYPLEGADVDRGSSLTVSNEFVEDRPVKIIFKKGAALLIRSVPEF